MAHKKEYMDIHVLPHEIVYDAPLNYVPCALKLTLIVDGEPAFAD